MKTRRVARGGAAAIAKDLGARMYVQSLAVARGSLQAAARQASSQQRE